jgi:transposase-like protein
VRLRRIEMITGAERRRKWSAEEKAEIVAESLAEGAVVSEVARRHGLSPQQLFGWRARLRAAVEGSAPSCDATPSESAVDGGRNPLPALYSAALPQSAQIAADCRIWWEACPYPTIHPTIEGPDDEIIQK